MKKENKIVVGIDFNELSILAFEHTIDLAKFLKAEIILVHSIESGYFSRLFDLKGVEMKKIREEANTRLKELCEKYTKSGVTVSYRIKEGKPYENILKVTGEEKARLIIVGKNGRLVKGEEKLLGSNARHIIGEAKTPVISITGQEKLIGFKDIVVPLDLTQQTRAQVFNAISFGLHYNATIHLVSALVAGISARKSRIYPKLRKAQKTIEENGVNSTIKLFKKSATPPYEAVLNYAHELNADLIMLMTHEETRGDNYIGAFAQQIIQKSDIPVLSLTSEAVKDEDQALVDGFVDPFGIITRK
ncbi:MAG: universal stress protein [Bacteroidota bacterium]